MTLNLTKGAIHLMFLFVIQRHIWFPENEQWLMVNQDDNLTRSSFLTPKRLSLRYDKISYATRNYPSLVVLWKHLRCPYAMTNPYATPNGGRIFRPDGSFCRKGALTLKRVCSDTRIGRRDAGDTNSTNEEPRRLS